MPSLADRNNVEHVVRAKIRAILPPGYEVASGMSQRAAWWHACSKLRDAVQLYTSSLISEAIGAIALLPPDDDFKRRMGDAADLIAHARMNGVTVDGLMLMIMEAEDG